MLDDRTWLLIGRKMANEASPQELKELENILRSNPELHFSLQTLSDLWQQAPVENSIELDAAYAKLVDALNQKGSDAPGAVAYDDFPETANFATYRSNRVLYLRRAIIAASVVALIVITALWLRPVPMAAVAKKDVREPASEISTRYGSKTNIVLPDGSKVWLNAGSKIVYDNDFGEVSREVQLTGEAYFDVVHNENKPFLIHTVAMDIKVLGTEFNVKSYPDEETTETSLIHGSIEVTLKDRKANRIILKPNQKLVVSNDQATDSVETETRKKQRSQSHETLFSLGTLNYFSLDSTIMETSWVDNRLIFEDESFEEIAVRMTRWYGLNFSFEDEQIRALRFTGNFKDETIDDALKAMQITADFRFKISDKKVSITKH